jgi:hypothetical protein
MKLNGEFTVKVNKYGKRTYEIIRAIEITRTLTEIIIKDICGKTRKFDRSEYEATKIYED